MVPHRFLFTLVLALPILVVTIGVVFGASSLAQALGDTTGAYALFWFAMAALIFLVIDILLLLAVLGIRAVESRDDENQP